MSKHTPGPWKWVLNPQYKTISLESHAWVVMSFERWGMNGASPTFLDQGILSKGVDFGKVIPGREHHKTWALEVDHANARLIAAAPELLEACQEYLIELQQRCEGWGERKEQHPDWRYMNSLYALVAKAKGEK